MRHVFLPVPVTACPQGMGGTATAARLVAPAGHALGLAARVFCAASGTINLAAVAMAADEHAGAAAGAQKKNAQAFARSVQGSRTHVDETCAGWDTASACVPGTVWGVALKPSLAVEIERPPAFNPGSVLPRSAALCQPLQRCACPQLSLPSRARLSNGGSSPCCACLRCR